MSSDLFLRLFERFDSVEKTIKPSLLCFMSRVRTRRWLLVLSAANPRRTAKNCLTSARLGTRHCSIRVSEAFGNLSDLIHPLHLTLSLGCVEIDLDWT
jgi:hypothetical protein